MKKVLVTGADGFIGRAVVNELHSRGFDYTLMDKRYGHDVRDVDFGHMVLGCDAVIHLAGILGTHELFDHVEEAIDINTKGTARLLQAVEKENEYRKMNYVGITMMDVWNNVYQATKIAGERLALAWHQHKGVPVTVVRAFNGYGPYQKVSGVQKIIPTFATRAWAGESIPIWGDGTNTVDLVHVGDIARILVDATSMGDGEVLDAGTGVPVTVVEVAERIIEHTGMGSWIDYLPMRKGEHLLEEPLVAKGEGWDKVERPEFDWGRVMETVDWYRA